MRIISTCFVIFSVTMNVLAQTKSLPSVRTKSNDIIMYLDGEKDNFNGIDFIPASFKYSFITEKETSSFILVSEKDSISMTLKQNVNTVFRIIRETKGDTVTCTFSTHKFIKPAVFSDTYKKENQGKTIIQIPEVYELFNVILSLSNYGKMGAINKETAHYKSVMKHFAPYTNHAAVRTMDSLLRATNDYYPLLKMDSYAYEFAGDKLVKNKIYDRISWGEKNELEPYALLLEDFAKKSHFRRFYQKNNGYYDSLVTDFQKNINVAAMKSWLEKQFPRTKYSAIKVIFSPLVGYNQSANNFRDNGFTEAQAHINFPFVSEKDKKEPAHIIEGKRMLIAFTEINHSYLNPEADRYAEKIAVSIKDLTKWTIAGKPSASYDNSLACFEEYMNYALVTLFFSDIFDQKTSERLKNDIEKSMVNFRGFQRFKEFDEKLLNLYKNKKSNETVADLYPAIIEWASVH